MAMAFSQLAPGNWQQELPAVWEMLTAKHHPLPPTTRGAGGAPGCTRVPMSPMLPAHALTHVSLEGRGSG